jgi:hypothetical protein
LRVTGFSKLDQQSADRWKRLVHRSTFLKNDCRTPAHARLLRIIREWLEQSGPDLSKIDRHAYAGLLVRSGSGLRMIPVPDVPGDGTRDVVSHYFIQLLLNPERERLGAPCSNCGQHYIKKTLRKSVFCSRPCADKKKLTTKRAKAHKRKLERVVLAMDNYATRPSKWAALNWKQWVLQAECDVTANFLTHAIKNKEITPIT